MKIIKISESEQFLDAACQQHLAVITQNSLKTGFVNLFISPSSQKTVRDES